MYLDLNRLRSPTFFAICKESLRVISSWRKDGVCKNSLLLLCVLSLQIFAFSMAVASFRVTYKYQKDSMDFSAIFLSHLKSTWFTYLQMILLSPYFYLKGISSAVYSAALILSGREEVLSPEDIQKIIQSVSKRALTTFLWSFAIAGSYTILGGFLAFFWVFFECYRMVGAVILIFYIMGFVYISSVSHLAQVVSILENVHGFEAFVRSRSIIRGNLGLSSAIFLLEFSSAGIIICLFSFMCYIVLGSLFSSPLVGTLVFMVVMASGVMASAMAILFFVVAETIVYLAFKSDHEDDLEKSSLADYLAYFFDEVNAGMADGRQAETTFSFQNPWLPFLLLLTVAFTMVVLLSDGRRLMKILFDFHY